MTNLCYGLTKCLYIHSTKASESKVETVLWDEKQFRTGHAWRHRRPAPQTHWGVAGERPYCLQTVEHISHPGHTPDTLVGSHPKHLNCNFQAKVSTICSFIYC